MPCILIALLNRHPGFLGGVVGVIPRVLRVMLGGAGLSLARSMPVGGLFIQFFSTGPA